MSVVRASGLRGDAALAAAGEWGGLTAAQIRSAVSYYAEYREEIDAWIARNVEEADAREEQWRREQNALV